MSKLTDSSPTQSANTSEETVSEADKTQEKSESMLPKLSKITLADCFFYNIIKL